MEEVGRMLTLLFVRNWYILCGWRRPVSDVSAMDWNNKTQRCDDGYIIVSSCNGHLLMQSSVLQGSASKGKIFMVA
jgi:hypothetical protein